MKEFIETLSAHPTVALGLGLIVGLLGSALPEIIRAFRGIK